jgi:hypothetical protein
MIDKTLLLPYCDSSKSTDEQPLVTIYTTTGQAFAGKIISYTVGLQSTHYLSITLKQSSGNLVTIISDFIVAIEKRIEEKLK